MVERFRFLPIPVKNREGFGEGLPPLPSCRVRGGSQPPPDGPRRKILYIFPTVPEAPPDYQETAYKLKPPRRAMVVSCVDETENKMMRFAHPSLEPANPRALLKGTISSLSKCLKGIYCILKLFFVVSKKLGFQYF